MNTTPIELSILKWLENSLAPNRETLSINRVPYDYERFLYAANDPRQQKGVATIVPEWLLHIASNMTDMSDESQQESRGLLSQFLNWLLPSATAFPKWVPKYTKSKPAGAFGREMKRRVAQQGVKKETKQETEKILEKPVESLEKWLSETAGSRDVYEIFMEAGQTPLKTSLGGGKLGSRRVNVYKRLGDEPLEIMSFLNEKKLVTNEEVLDEAWDIFKTYATKHGYKDKIVGDYAFKNSKGKILRLKGVDPKTGKIRIWEEGVGYLDLNLGR